MAPREFTSKRFNLIFLLLVSIPIIAIAYDAFNLLAKFSQNGHDVITSIFNHVSNDISLYALPPIMLAIRYYHLQRQKWKDMKKEYIKSIRHWQDIASKKGSESNDYLQRYSNLKQSIRDAVTPCGEIVFNSDDTVSLHHLFCKGYRKLEGDLRLARKEASQLAKENRSLRTENMLLRRRRNTPPVTVEDIEAMKFQVITEKNCRLERADCEAELRKVEIRELKADLKEMNGINNGLVRGNNNLLKNKKALLAENTELKALSNSEAAATIEQLRSELSSTKAQLCESERDFEDLMGQNEELNLDRTKYQSQAEEAIKSLASLDSQFTDLRKALKDKTSEVERIKSSTENEVLSGRLVNQQLTAELQGLKNLLSVREEELVFSKSSDQTNLASLSLLRANLQTTADELAKEQVTRTGLEAILEETKAQYNRDIAAARSETRSPKNREPTITGADIRASTEYQVVCSAGEKIEQERDQLRSQVEYLQACLQSAPTTETIVEADRRYDLLHQLYEDECAKVAERDRMLETSIALSCQQASTTDGSTNNADIVGIPVPPSAAQDSLSECTETMKLLHDMNLISSQSGETLLEQVAFLADEHNRHREGATWYFSRYREIEQELCKRYGPQQPVGDTPLVRVKKLMARPENMKGALRG